MGTTVLRLAVERKKKKTNHMMKLTQLHGVLFFFALTIGYRDMSKSEVFCIESEGLCLAR